MSQPPWPSAWRLTCAPGAAEEDAKCLALMKDLEELDDVAGHIIPAPKLLVWPSEDNWSLEIENPFAEEQPASLEQVLLPSSIAAEDTLRTVSCEGSAASATEDAQASPSVEPMTGEHEPFVDHEPIKENSCNEVIEIDSSSDSDEDMPSRPRRHLPPHRYNVYSDSDVEMEEADETEEPENKPKLPLPTPPPFHRITKAPNIAIPGEGYDLTFDGFGKEMLRIDKRKDQYGHLTYAQFNKRFPSTYKASADGKCFSKLFELRVTSLEVPTSFPYHLSKRLRTC
ncbi:hypothetical protein JG687_00017580 [Phytophthora cactorum]|uniref:Uncharacterized protein n=1 Tax=Phytophthora cactorum TaxID=29920 RepID=A0A8T1TPL6_9STRA|nr:hypothetical protein JG687_00017580 [Phytophthora cactorum]